MRGQHGRMVWVGIVCSVQCVLAWVKPCMCSAAMRDTVVQWVSGGARKSRSGPIHEEIDEANWPRSCIRSKACGQVAGCEVLLAGLKKTMPDSADAPMWKGTAYLARQCAQVAGVLSQQSVQSPGVEEMQAPMLSI